MKVGILGLGHIGRKHIAAIQSLEGVSLVATCDTDSIAVDDIPHFTSLEDLLASEISMDLISVCTPNAYHAQHSIQVLNAGKHVICEKPMTLDKKSSEALIDAALHNGRHVFCVMQNRYSPISQWLYDLMSSEVLGEIYVVNVHCNWNRDDRYYKKGHWHGSSSIDGGTLFTQFAHYIDTLYWLLGDIKVTNALFDNFNHQGLIDFEDAGIFNFSFGDRGKGIFQYTTAIWDKNFESTLSIIAENGTIKVGGQYMDQVQYCHIKNYNAPSLPASNNLNNLSKIYQNAFKCVYSNDRLMTNAMDGMKVVEIIENVYSFK